MQSIVSTPSDMSAQPAGLSRIARMRLDYRIPFVRPAPPALKPLPYEKPTAFTAAPPMTGGWSSHHLWVDKAFSEAHLYHIATIPKGLANAGGDVFDVSGRRLERASHKWHANPGFGAFNVNLRRSILSHRHAPTVFVPGEVLVVTASAAKLYFHWLYEIVPRLHLARTINGHCPVYVDASAPFMRETLALMGITNIIDASKVPRIQADAIIVPCYNIESGMSIPRWTVDIVRDVFSEGSKSKTSKGRRLYLSRAKAGRRRVENEQDITQVLEREGFETVYPETMTMQQQVALFSQATMVIGPSGGAFSNIVFCHGPTRVMNVFHWKANNIFHRVCETLKMQYFYVSSRDTDVENAQTADYKIDMTDFGNTFRLFLTGQLR